MLVDLWVEHHDMLESKESRKTWGLIVEELNTRGQCSKTVEKCMRKIKYIVSKYKEAKEWNRKQTGGNIKKSIYYDKIDSVLGCRDVVTLKHVVDSGPSTTSSAEYSPATLSTSSDTGDCEERTPSPRERTARKKGGKGKKRKAVDLEDSDDDVKTVLSGIQKQSGEVAEVLKTMQQAQMQQISVMNKFMEKMFDASKTGN